MKNAHYDEKTKDTAMENVEVVIDTFAEHFLTGDIQKIVVGLPIINNVTAVVALVHNIKNYSIAKKISAFVKTIQEGVADKEKYQRLADKYGEEKILEEVLVQIDRFGKEEQAEVYGRLFTALLDGEFDWKEYCMLAYFVERANPMWLVKPFDSPLCQDSCRLGGAVLGFRFSGQIRR